MRRALFAVCVAWALCAHARPAQDSAAAQGRRATLRASNILDALMRYRAQRPGLSADALARHGNALLARRGFDYDFDVCDIFGPEEAGAAEAATLTLDRRLTRLDGRGIDFRLVTDNRGGMCSECFLTLPALRVTKGEMHVVSGGVAYALRRPAGFRLDEAQLLGADMKTVLRTWHLPFQAAPSGISPDGRRLYVEFYEGQGPRELVLELSDDGRPRFRAKSEVAAGGGEWVEDYPKGPNNSYEGCMRFRAGGRTYTVRFTSPCT